MSALVALVTAAGRGVRFGGPKVLAPWRSQSGVTLLGLAHLGARAVDCEQALLVVRETEVGALRDAGIPNRGRLVVSREPDADGPAGSIACGLAALPEEFDGWVLLTPVDVPPASGALVAALLLAARGTTCEAVRPVHAGRGGHPVLVRASTLRSRYVSGRPPLREVLRGLGAGLRDHSVEDPGVLLDFDTRAALLEALGDGSETSRA